MFSHTGPPPKGKGKGKGAKGSKKEGKGKGKRARSVPAVSHDHAYDEWGDDEDTYYPDDGTPWWAPAADPNEWTADE